MHVTEVKCIAMKQECPGSLLS